MKQTDENHQTFDPTKIPRGRSKTNHQLKFQHQQIFKNNRRPQFYKHKLYQQILMDKSPHQLAKRTISTSSEEFRKFVKRLLYEDTSNINFPKSLKHRIMHQRKTILQTFEDLKSTQENFTSTQFNSSISSSIHQQLEQQSNAENQMK